MTEALIELAPGLTGALALPDRPRGLVLLLDGSGGHREQARQRVLAGYLRRRQIATVRIGAHDHGPDQAHVHGDAPAEPDDARHVATLAHDLLRALGGVRKQPALAALPVGVFAAGASAASALACAAERPGDIRAIVTRSGRADLVANELSRVTAPVLMVVGGFDADLIEVAREAIRAMPAVARLELIARSTRLFEEAGALERVALAAADWFEAHLGAASASATPGTGLPGH
jgi:pimeloyl-ACP methyl ester carboxylesterase